MAHIFLTENLSEGITKYFAINESKIETLKLFETFDKYGQKVGHENAGDYHFSNSSSDAIHSCKNDIADKFLINYDDIHIVEEDNNEFKIEAGDGEEYGFNEETVNKFITEWRKENEVIMEVKGFTYWNGHNFRTIVTEDSYGEPTHLIVDDENLISELNKAIDEKSFEKQEFGCKIYKGNGFIIIDSYWPSTWAEYEIVAEDDYEVLKDEN